MCINAWSFPCGTICIETCAYKYAITNKQMLITVLVWLPLSATLCPHQGFLGDVSSGGEAASPRSSVGEASSATASAVRAAGSKSSSARIAAKSTPVISLSQPVLAPGLGANGPAQPPVLGTATPVGLPAATRAVPEPPRVQRSISSRRAAKSET